MADNQTQTTQSSPQQTITPHSAREFINVQTAVNSRLNKGFNENIYGSQQYETKEVIEKSK